MRIAILHNSSPGGALRFLIELTGRLSTTDEVEVWTWSDEPDPPIPGAIQHQLPGPAFRLPSPLHPFGDLVRSVMGSRRVARAVDKAEFDVVLAFACRWTQAPEALRALQTPTIYFAHEGRRRSVEKDYRPSGEIRSGWRRPVWAVGTFVYDSVGGALDRRAMHGARLVLANSAFTARNLEAEYGVRPAVVELTVDRTIFRPQPGICRRRQVLAVGALDPTKGAELLVRSVATMDPSVRPSIHWVFNRGSDAYRHRIEDLAKQEGVVLVLRGQITDMELVDEYASASAVVALSVREPFGLTVPEASATGTPVVAVRDGNFVSTVIPGVNGLLVERAPHAIANALLAILSAKVRFNEEAMVALAAERWSWDRCVAAVRTACAAAAENMPSPL